MLSGFARLLLTGTAMAPVGLTYAWVAYMQGQTAIALSLLGVCALLLLICVLLLRLAKRNLATSDFKPSLIEAADHQNAAFLLLYVMPLFTDRIEALEWQFWIPVVIIFSVITATGYNYHSNPLLGLLGWHFYKVESPEGVTFVLITKKHLRSAANNLQVGQLTEYILLDMGGR